MSLVENRKFGNLGEYFHEILSKLLTEYAQNLTLKVLFSYFVVTVFSRNKLKVCDNPAWSRSTGVIFPTAFPHFMPWCHIWVILAKFQTSTLLLYLLL